MKIELNESRFQTSITIRPEDVVEVANLFRLIKNSKRKTAEMYLTFSEYAVGVTPYLSIIFEKKAPYNVVSSISNNK